MSILVFDLLEILLSTQEAPPLIPTLTSDRYHIKWTQLANLPTPIYGAYVTVLDKKVYVAGGGSPDDDAKHQVYMSMMLTLTSGVIYLPWATIMQFLTSLVAS